MLYWTLDIALLNYNWYIYIRLCMPRYVTNTHKSMPSSGFLFRVPLNLKLHDCQERTSLWPCYVLTYISVLVTQNITGDDKYRKGYNLLTLNFNSLNHLGLQNCFNKNGISYLIFPCLSKYLKYSVVCCSCLQHWAVFIWSFLTAT